MASVNLRKRKTSQDSLVRLLRTVNFIDALVSVLTLQNTLIMVVGGEGGRSLLPLTSVVTAFIFSAVLVLSVLSIVKAARRVKDRRSSCASPAAENSSPERH